MLLVLARLHLPHSPADADGYNYSDNPATSLSCWGRAAALRRSAAGTRHQGELVLEDDAEEPDRSRLMAALDTLKQRYGRGTLLMASAGLAGDLRAWSIKQERRTPGYTIRWADIAVAHAPWLGYSGGRV